MNTILLNDTRSDEHIGCELVVTNSLRKCQEYGLNVTTTISTAQAPEASNLLSPLLLNTDLVLLNGEGTLHDDKDNALSLLEAAKLAKEKGCKVVLYNALWANNPKGKSYLPNFDLIFCRDQASLEAVLSDYPEAIAEVVPDMTFVTEIPKMSTTERQGTLVTDSVRKKKCISLAKFAISNNYSFAPMSTAFFRKLKGQPLLRWRISKKLTQPVGEIDTPNSFLHKLLTTDSVITGRFHTACLSLLCGTPVYCISSNTQKIQSLLKDFGLESSATMPELPVKSVMEKQWTEHTEKREATQEKVKTAAARIDSMFQSISSLA